MEHLEQLSSLAAILNQETDSYTQSLAALEKKLNSMNLGIEAWVVLTESGQEGTPNRDSYQRILFGYAKTDEGWGFAIKEKRVERGFWQNDEDCPWENEYDEGPAKLLLKSSRELRIKAARQLENLMQTLTARANEVIPTLQNAQRLAGEY